MIGPHVFGDGRLGCWFTPVLTPEGQPLPGSFSSKLRDRLPRVRNLGVTDAFLPRVASLTDKLSVLDERLFPALYQTPPAGVSAPAYADQALRDLARLGLSVLEQNIEGVPDAQLEAFVRADVDAIRERRRLLRLRLNVVPFKGAYLPADLFASDAQLYVIVQNYLGNMDERVAEDEIVRDLVDHGIPREKVSAMYGAHIGSPPENRVPALPVIRWRGSIYQDDLLADAGLI